MTTFDSKGRIRSRFMPPTDENGRPLTHASWIQRKAINMLRDGKTKEETLAWLRDYEERLPQAAGVDEAMSAVASYEATDVQSEGQGK